MQFSLIIHSGTARAYTVPTDAPEADGTFAWNSTTMVVVHLSAGELKGIGYSYTHKLAAKLAQELIEKYVAGKDAFNIPAIFAEIRKQERNYGREGIAATAISAIDAALWDLKAKALGVSLTALLGAKRNSAPVYGSGGFTTYNESQMRDQLAGWITSGIGKVKIKIGTHPDQDLERVRFARSMIGKDAELFVDANGSYTRKQALYFANRFAEEADVRWFEEPVTSDDLAGLHLLRDEGPAGMDIAAGEYAWDVMNLRRMLDAEAVDVLQADATRCGGVTGFMAAAAMCEAHPIPMSAHCAPTLHVALACAAPTLQHIEYFHDHVRIESMLFDGFLPAQNGVIHPDLSRPGFGIEFKQKDAEPFADDL